jgi:hypothetical protein
MRPMKRKSKHSLGMTAIEVLVATLLASVMLGSVVGLLGTLTRQERALRKRASIPPAWHAQLADQLQWDLTNSREFIVSPDRITLVGFASRDFATDQPTGRPAQIAYYLIDAIDGRWLARSENHCDVLTNDSSRVELLCHGVNSFQFGATLVDQASGRTSKPPADAIATPVPERVAVQIFSTTSGEPFFDQLILTR